jgi:uncharacterized membrane-anchored protein
MTGAGWRGAVALLTAVAALTAVNFSIAAKERLLAHGRIVFLELAPVDPRSLMQGDYMQLNYRVAEEIARFTSELGPEPGPGPEPAQGDGRVVVTLDPRSVASFARLESSAGGGPALADNEAYLRYRVRAGRLKFASDAFFFQEGTAEAYQSARYGRYRVADNGELLLTSLHDENLIQLPAEHQ